MKFNVYYISDQTAITAEAFGKTLLSQFDSIQFKQTTYRYINDIQKAQKLMTEINSVPSDNLPIIFSTLINSDLRKIIATSHSHFIDLFNIAIPNLENIFSTTASYNPGLAHGKAQDTNYEQRMDAVNFALLHDDGLSIQHYDKADIILTGVSRSGKTPTCLYLAMHYGIYAANFPLTEENLHSDNLHNENLPAVLNKHRTRVFALTIQADRLQKIRASRLPGTQYSSLKQCKLEIRQVEKLITNANFPVLDVTSSSVEEIATTILQYCNNNVVAHT